MAKDKEGDEAIPLTIVKPESFLEKFRSKRPPTIAGVATLLTALPLLRIADANDFVRLHPSEEDYWSPELCFVSVPIKGEKRDMLHLIDEEIAVQYLPSKKITAAAPGPGVEAPRRLLPLHRAVAKLGQLVELNGNRGLRESQDARGFRLPRARRRASRLTRSSTRATRTPFPIRNGRRARLMSCSKSRFATPTSTPTITRLSSA